MATLTRVSRRFIGTAIPVRLGWNPAASTERFHHTVGYTASKVNKYVLWQSFPRTVMNNNSFCTEGSLTQAEIKRAVDNISEKFTEAMELMNDARSSAGTVYFSEDMEDTTAQVQETLQDYHALLERLTEKQKKQVIQSIGLKMEELKAQMSLLQDLARE
ncbi:hypothetical protein C7M84_025036 [Penaeus vannamei]|uniref:Uncharacterized protein n=1 Tax=Penaeus vannamei TaxID=6689 RepID=A0A423TZB9_PENVA|nr:uncharacterized protein LOC113802171 [Penaeus vannamei]XP_027208493.1 uncharacterized protein LOC113802171 [Penaeus vannamei]ROT81809.1 hypothetical protein C7M84_025036 [Penaeus vannamei]